MSYKNLLPLSSFAFILLFCLTQGFVSFSADDRAAEILDQAETNFRSLQDFSTQFKYELNNPSMGIEEVVSNGNLYYSQGRYAIMLGDQEVYCNLRKQWFFERAENVVRELSYHPGNLATMEAVLRIYSIREGAEYIKNEDVGAHTCHKLKIATLDPDLAFSQAYVWINEETLLIQKVALIDPNQTVSTFTFNDLQQNVGFMESDFIFDPSVHPQVEVIHEG